MLFELVAEFVFLRFCARGFHPHQQPYNQNTARAFGADS